MLAAMLVGMQILVNCQTCLKIEIFQKFGKSDHMYVAYTPGVSQ
jgi:hypothetical protein